MDDMIHRYANLKQTPVSVKNMILFGKDANMNTLLRSHAFLRYELPIRLAHIAKEITALPEELLEVEPVQKVLNWYRLSFSEVIESPVPNVADMELKTEDDQCASLHQFQDMLDHIKDRHSGVVTTMAEGVLELKNRLGREMIDTSVQFFLDRLYMNRISIRMLITQHLELFKQAQTNNNLCAITSGASGRKVTPNKKNRWVGIIDPQCNVKEIAEDAVADARYLCSNNYSVCPSVQIIVPPKLGTETSAGAPTLPYVPSHLYHMLFETIKNSLRAVVEVHGANAQSEDDLPPVRVVLVKGTEDLTIKISDMGGGIPNADVPKLFTYFYTTAAPPTKDTLDSLNEGAAPMAGLGYGLPISRLYARYFGGDLKVIPMEGYGTDAYIHLKAAGETREVLPEYSPSTYLGSQANLREWLNVDNCAFQL